MVDLIQSLYSSRSTLEISELKEKREIKETRELKMMGVTMKKLILYFAQISLVLNLSVSGVYAQNTSTLSQDHTNHLRDNVDSIQLSEGEAKAQEVMGYLQMAYPFFKQIINASQSDIVQKSPSCWDSRFMQFVGLMANVTLLTRLTNMVMNLVEVGLVLKKMTALVMPQGNAAETINQLAFYELMLREYAEYARFAFVDMLADIFDLSASGIEVILATIELAVPSKPCVPASS